MNNKPPRTDIFISSTSIDLPDHRAAVIKAINALHLTPLGMELWPKTGEKPVEKCRKMVADAEVFLGIYAYRYGWRPDGPGTKSITEMEYDWAGEQGIPRICFIMSDDHPWPADLMEHDAKADLDAFKARVQADEVGFFTTPDNLAAQVTAALARYTPRSNDKLLEPYLRWLHAESRRSGLLRVLNPRDLTDDSQSVTVEQVYTPLNTRQPVVRRKDDGSIVNDSAIRNSLVHGNVDKQHTLSLLSAMEATNFNNRLVLLGDPGSGKSTFVKFLALALSGHLLDRQANWLETLKAQGWTRGEYLPLLVILREFAQDVPDGATTGAAGLLFAHLESQLKLHKLERCFPAIESALNEGGVLLLLDGLDEVPAEKRETVRQSISDFMQRCHPANRAIVTCRVLSYTNPAWKLAGMSEETIAPFDREQIAHFVRAWYTALSALGELDANSAERRAKELVTELRDERLSRIAENPMLLTVMAIVHDKDGRLPREIAVLYQRCVELLMQKWRPQAADSLTKTLNVSEIDLYQLLYQIAYEAHRAQGQAAGAADIPEPDILRPARAALSGELSKAEAFCNYVEQQAGLLVGRGQAADGWRVFSFPHRSFQEFLAGCYAANHDFPELAPELAEQGAHWREALLLATGHLVFNQGQTTLALAAIDTLCPAENEPTSEQGWRNVWLAGEMLLLVGISRAEATRKGPPLLKRLRGRLVRLIEGGHLPPVERAAAGRVLGWLGDPRPGVGLKTPLPDANAEGQGVRALPDIAWADEIPAGRYTVGGDPEAYQSFERHEIEIKQPYRVAKYLITQAQYLAFEGDSSERGYDCPDWWDRLAADEVDKYPYQPGFPNPNHPIEDVNWYQAVAFCRWLTWHSQTVGLLAADQVIRLPTEYEWEVAARGTDARAFPWGNEWDTAHCNSDESGIGQTSTVGLFPDGVSPYGALDLSGNVWEFCATKWRENHSEPEDNNMDGTDARSARGGSWLSHTPLSRRAARRGGCGPSARDYDVGFRVCCAYRMLPSESSGL